MKGNNITYLQTVQDRKLSDRN